MKLSTHLPYFVEDYLSIATWSKIQNLSATRISQGGVDVLPDFRLQCPGPSGFRVAIAHNDDTDRRYWISSHGGRLTMRAVDVSLMKYVWWTKAMGD